MSDAEQIALQIILDRCNERTWRMMREVVLDRDAWRNAMQGLTPGGSEFTTPFECTAWLLARMHPDIIVKQGAEIKQLTEERDRLRAENERLQAAWDRADTQPALAGLAL